jgi:hypothetical protein
MGELPKNGYQNYINYILMPAKIKNLQINAYCLVYLPLKKLTPINFVGITSLDFTPDRSLLIGPDQFPYYID